MTRQTTVPVTKIRRTLCDLVFTHSSYHASRASRISNVLTDVFSWRYDVERVVKLTYKPRPFDWPLRIGTKVVLYF